MTGPAPGKIAIEKTKVILYRDKEIKELDNPTIYIHLKGYSYAKVTHLDIEHRELNNLIKGKGGYYKLKGIPHGIIINLDNQTKITLRHKLMNKILDDGDETYAWIGAKEDGIYIGFKKKFIHNLEKIASEIISSRS